MPEDRKVQYIMLEFPFIDSALFDEWDARGMKLYWKIRRYICRSQNHRLGGYWSNGFLAVEGFLGTWASSINVSKPVISRLLKWMEEKDIVVCAHKSQRAGDPNIYILGRVFMVPGSQKPIEVFFLDHHYESQSVSKIPFQNDTTSLPTITAVEVRFNTFDVPMTIHPPELCQVMPGGDTVSVGKQSVSVQQQTVSVGKGSNIEDLIEKNEYLPAPKTSAGNAPKEERVPLDEEFGDKQARPKWQIPDNEEQKEILAICRRRYFKSKEKTRLKALLRAIKVGDALGDGAYQKCLDELEDISDLGEAIRLPPVPRSWLEFKSGHAKNNRWSFGGLLDALYDRDKLAEHCLYSLKKAGKVGRVKAQETAWIDD